MSGDAKPKTALLPPGTVLDDRFEIKEFLGAGSFGAVYRARQLVFGHALREVALKLFKADKVTSRNVQEVFADAVTLIGLHEECPAPEIARAVVEVYDLGIVHTPAEQAFLSMKLVPGKKTLESPILRWKNGGMPVELTLKFLRQILVPLAWMHTLATPAVHGDLKPDNVLLTENSELVLTDFGLAARLPLASVGGAIEYQAPESLLGGTAETPADVYGVGLIWYEMLTGHHPFRNVGLQAIADGDDKAYVQAHAEARKWPFRPADDDESPRLVPPSEINEELRRHPQLEAMLQKCLAYRQHHRYANAHLLLAAVDEYLAKGFVKDLGPPVQPQTAGIAKPALLPKTPEMLVQDIKTLLDGGMQGKALALAEQVVDAHPQFVPGLLILARALAEAGQIEKAKERCAQAQQLDREEPDVLGTLAGIYEKAGKTGMAANLRVQERTMRQKKTQATKRRI